MMYRLLLVDNEPNIVKGLYELMQEVTEPELDIIYAYSAQEALAWMERTKIDIVLTDIRMPGMSGLELHERILKLWPRCQVIYLTGYDDFHYAQTAIKLGGVDYLLKTDDDDLVIAAIRRAAERIAKEIEQAYLLQKANRQMKESLPILRREYLLQLLGSDTHPGTKMQARFHEYEIGLDPALSVLLLIGRVDKWETHLHSADKSLLSYAVQNIAEECLSGCRIVSVAYEAGRWAWLIQPSEREGEALDWTRTETYVHGMLDTIQTAGKQLLKLPLSFVAASQACEWEHLQACFTRLRRQMSQGLGMSGEMLMIETFYVLQEGVETRELHSPAAEPGDGSVKTSSVRQLMKFANQLSDDMETGQKEAYFRCFEEAAVTAVTKEGADHTRLQEIYWSVTGVLLTFVNHLKSKLEPQYIEIPPLEAHPSWPAAVAFLRELSERLFECREDDQEERTHEVVRKINTFIANNLNGDLSLTKLGEVVHLHPTYLCRLYKRITGVGVSDRINEERIGVAKELLADRSLRIHEIAHRVGFVSPSYFIRFFKKTTRLTPQEYRDSLIEE